MRRSKRKINSEYASPTRCDEPQIKRCTVQTVFDSPRSISKDDSILNRLLEVCLLRIMPHVWMKIIPSSSRDVEHMSFSMGRSWELIKMLLISFYLLIWRNLMTG